MTGSRAQRDASRVIGGPVVGKETCLYQRVGGIVGLSLYPRTGLRDLTSSDRYPYKGAVYGPPTRLPDYPQVDPHSYPATHSATSDYVADYAPEARWTLATHTCTEQMRAVAQKGNCDGRPIGTRTYGRGLEG